MESPRPARLGQLPEILLPLAPYLYFSFRYQSLAYMAGGVVLYAAFLLALRPWRGRSPTRLPLGTLILAALALVLPALSLLQFHRLMDPGDVDHSCYACALWNLRHGETRYSVAGMDIFGSHANYTLVLWMPVQIAFGEFGLKAGKILCLLGAAWLLFRGHGTEDRDNAALGAAALLLSPPILSQFFYGFHPEFLAAPILVLVLQAYRERNLAGFLAGTAFLAYTKETLTLATAGILLLALAERRPWRWILAPGLLCVAQMAVYWFVIVPASTGGGNHMQGYLPAWHQVPAAMARSGNLAYLLHLFLAFLPLLFRLPRRYLLLPLPLTLFYTLFPDPSFRDVGRHYAFPIALLAAGGLVLHSRPGRGTLLSFLLASILCYPLGRPRLDFLGEDGRRASAVADFHAALPAEASVLVHGPFVARFAARKEVGNWVYRYRPFASYDYFLADSRFVPEWMPEARERLARDLDSLSASPDWMVVGEKEGIRLLKRRVAGDKATEGRR